jgi:hypothetical protein
MPVILGTHPWGKLTFLIKSYSITGFPLGLEIYNFTSKFPKRCGICEGMFVVTTERKQHTWQRVGSLSSGDVQSERGETGPIYFANL